MRVWSILKSRNYWFVCVEILAWTFALFLLPIQAQTKPLDKLDNVKAVEWLVSDKDMNLEIAEENISKGKHTSRIERLGSAADKALIKKAEALYPREFSVPRYAEGYDRNKEPQGLSKDAPKITEEEPFWSESIFDGVKIPAIVSTRAIDYYRTMSESFRSKTPPTNISMISTSFSYTGSAQHYDNYEIGNNKYTAVKVVTLKLAWSQYCGNLCAMGFGRNKIVIFNDKNEPVGMFIDTETGAVVS